eukprot:Gb_23022 [translate_table: standard]
MPMVKKRSCSVEETMAMVALWRSGCRFRRKDESMRWRSVAGMRTRAKRSIAAVDKYTVGLECTIHGRFKRRKLERREGDLSGGRWLTLDLERLVIPWRSSDPERREEK